MNIQDFVGAGNTIGVNIWEKKYRHDGETFDQWLDRVSGGNASVRNLIAERKFLFGGRILANRGIKGDEKVSLSNCYVVTKPEDNLESIYNTCSKLARTYSYGGGCGIDISNLSPAGARVRNQAKTTSGAVSFMDTFSQVTHQIGQNSRRGALMISLDCHHPDLPEFISIKNDLSKVTGANISVRVTDDFMKAVENNEDWTMRFTREETGEIIERTIPARDLYFQLCENNWNYAEPGLLFWDTIENYNLLANNPDFKFGGVNPCAEEPLPEGGSCLLGALNLAEFVSETGSFDWKAFQDAVKIAVIALNEVLDEGLPKHPLQEQRDTVRDWRQIGLGIMGLADMLIKLGIRYGSDNAIYICDEIGYTMARTAIQTSAELARQYGKYPKCNSDILCKTGFFYNHCIQGVQNPWLKHRVLATGLRNSQLLTIAPTGSISTMLGVSGGIEPIFAYSYTRTTKSLSDHDEIYAMHPKIVADYMIAHDCHSREELPDYFVFSEDVPVEERISMQAIWQEHIDASISSTINLPHETTVEDIATLYMLAWSNGLKGVTVYRAGCAREGILVKDSDKTKSSDIPALVRGEIVACSNELVGRKTKLQTGCGSLHVQAWFDPHTSNLMEVFLSKGSTGGCANFMTGLSRMISLACRAGVSIQDIKDQLDSTGVCPSYATRRAVQGDTSKGSCCPMAVGNALIEMWKDMKEKINDDEKNSQNTDSVQCKAKSEPASNFNLDEATVCPECGEPVVREGGCIQCKSCGWSKCE